MRKGRGNFTKKKKKGRKIKRKSSTEDKKHMGKKKFEGKTGGGKMGKPWGQTGRFRMEKEKNRRTLFVKPADKPREFSCWVWKATGGRTKKDLTQRDE